MPEAAGRTSGAGDQLRELQDAVGMMRGGRPQATLEFAGPSAQGVSDNQHGCSPIMVISICRYIVHRYIHVAMSLYRYVDISMQSLYRYIIIILRIFDL